MRNDTSMKVCQKCGGLCCKTVGGPNVTKKEMRKVLNAGHSDFFVKHGGNHYEIRSKHGTCLYLGKDNLCSIHKVRPSICRGWPADYSYSKGKLKLFLVECPLTKYASERYIKRMEEQILKLPQETILDFYGSTYLTEPEVKLIKKGQARFKRKELRLARF